MTRKRSTGLRCPQCGDETAVVDSRDAGTRAIRRRRECKRCGHRCVSIEMLADVVHDGRVVRYRLSDPAESVALTYTTTVHVSDVLIDVGNSGSGAQSCASVATDGDKRHELGSRVEPHCLATYAEAGGKAEAAGASTTTGKAPREWPTILAG